MQTPAHHLAEEAILRGCLPYAARHIGPGLTRDDLLQAARLSLHRARLDGLLPTDSAEHLQRYIARRGLGAMLEENTRAWRARPLGVLAAADAPELEAPDRPDVMCQLRQVVTRLLTLANPRAVECLGHMADGADPSEAARAVGVSPSRVSQFRREARDIASTCW